MTRWSGSSGAAVFACLVVLSARPVAAGERRPDPERVLVRGPGVIEITQALYGAIRRLESPSCRQLFTDFVDHEGRTVGENLGAMTPAEYLARLVIRDGEIPKGSGRCASPGAAAFTVDGAAVFVCGRNFRRQKPPRREIALIHEMLHTLGVRENPPSSAEITRQVERRCGS